MEIEINNTPAANDDLVALKWTVPPLRHRVDCRIRVTSPCAGGATVVLTNPDGRLRFPDASDTSRTLIVPGDGSWARFQISGENPSNAIGDAEIEAHCATATGPVKATKAVTVFWFDEARINIATPGSYTWVGDQFTTTGGTAVTYSAQARIRPAGVDCAAPQVANLRVGIMQNTPPPRIREKTWSNPRIRWNPGVAAGTTVTVPTTVHQTITISVLGNDSEPSVVPLYDQPGKTGTLDSDSLKPPIGCSGGGAATSYDTPATTLAPLEVPATTASGTVVGRVTYQRLQAHFDFSFLTWTVIFNTSTNEFGALRERPWTLRVDSSAATAQKASVGTDSAPAHTPALVPLSNDLVNDPRNKTSGPVGAATTTFTK